MTSALSEAPSDARMATPMIPIGASEAEAMQPFFTIIMPAFNRAGLVVNAIESIIRQDFAQWELIIVDDGSTDNTFDAVRPYVLGDRRIRYHYAANRGLAMARNIGISSGRGEYFTFLDSDDEYLPEHLGLRWQLLRDAPETQLLHGGVEVLGAQTVADKFDPTRLIPISECVVGGTFFIRRDLALTLGGFRDIIYGDDHEFFERAVASGAVIRRTDHPTYRYDRRVDDSLCSIVEREGIDGIKRLRGITDQT